MVEESVMVEDKKKEQEELGKNKRTILRAFGKFIIYGGWILIIVIGLGIAIAISIATSGSN